MYQLRMLCGSDSETTGIVNMSADQVRAMKGPGRSAGAVLEDAVKEPKPKGKGRRRRRRRK